MFPTVLTKYLLAAIVVVGVNVKAPPAPVDDIEKRLPSSKIDPEATESLLNENDPVTTTVSAKD